VRISVGAPRAEKYGAFVSELAPTWQMLNEGYGQKEYFEYLERSGVSVIKERLKAIACGAGAREVLLRCFESLSPQKVAAGQWCHRCMFAD
jgi:hypothetical protein